MVCKSCVADLDRVNWIEVACAELLLGSILKTSELNLESVVLLASSLVVG
jgi:hypothetical protein